MPAFLYGTGHEPRNLVHPDPLHLVVREQGNRIDLEVCEVQVAVEGKKCLVIRRRGRKTRPAETKHRGVPLMNPSLKGEPQSRSGLALTKRARVALLPGSTCPNIETRREEAKRPDSPPCPGAQSESCPRKPSVQLRAQGFKSTLPLPGLATRGDGEPGGLRRQGAGRFDESKEGGTFASTSPTSTPPSW